MELHYSAESTNDREVLRKYARPEVSRDLVPDRDNRGFGYVNRDGAFVIRDSRFAGGDAFSEGLAPVIMTDGNGVARWGYIDTKG